MSFEDLLYGELKRALNDENDSNVVKFIKDIDNSQSNVEKYSKNEMKEIIFRLAKAVEERYAELQNVKYYMSTLFPSVIKYEGNLYFNDDHVEYKDEEFYIRIYRPKYYHHDEFLIPIKKINEPTQEEIDAFEEEVKYIYSDQDEWMKEALHPPKYSDPAEPEVRFEERYCEKCMQTPCMCSDPDPS